ncbi:hypothetical protein [Olivibacter domesticus]|uniref:Uncharacterized protein n=1 Tax=Olivibacter domesticus TaxID=407022 RepID=A0A1H7WZ16_OLID1|nr:hypothetical protein [Olivibacter domesticus]SEM26872.1 hypothetical protein SAMN05661044_04739 [Olivibacter domesticus]
MLGGPEKGIGGVALAPHAEATTIPDREASSNRKPLAMLISFFSFKPFV